MLIFFDTEFTGLVIDPKLISIGLIDESGEETFYAELSDTWHTDDASSFVQAAVLPLLEGGTALMTMDELTLRLGNWIEDFEQPVTLATDSLTWDWPWIREIFYIPGTWPANLQPKPASLHDMVQHPAFDREVEFAFARGLRRHHALEDARANRLAWFATIGK